MKVKYLYVLAIVAALMMAACGKNDSDLQKAASSKLAADNVNGVTVAVKDGNATLTGEVADVTVKTKAEASVKGVEGIKSVDASGVKLKPLPPAPTPMGDDKMMEGTINENLKKANISGVTAMVSNGEVTLMGEVPKADLAKAMQAASSANPKKINNQLKTK